MEKQTTKEKVLQYLSQNQGSVVSGQQIAELCGVSRAAIWKAINSLREDGCQISGTTNGGYELLSSDDVFSKELFEKYLYNAVPELSDELKKYRIDCFKKIDSTNTCAKRFLSENPDMKKGIIVAECQTAGRGRLGRTFYSPSNTGIYLSVIYSPDEIITQPATITAFSAVAVCRAIKKLYNIKTSIKWINDIFANGKKIVGILTEGFTNFESGQIESAIIGIGINLKDNPDVFPDDVKKIVGSIAATKSLSENGANSQNQQIVGRCELAAEVAAQVIKIMDENPAEVLKEYKENSFLIGTEVTVFPVAGNSEKSYRAKAVDIDENAGLVVELPDGTRKTLSSGEVSLKSSSFV